MTEYVLWGRSAETTDALDEQVLTCTSDVQRIARVQELATRDGFHMFRVQVLDGARPDFLSIFKPAGC